MIKIFCKQKGQEILQWTFIRLLILLVLVTFTVFPMQTSVEEAARNNERLIVQELTTSINLAQSSHVTTNHKAVVPTRGKRKCEIRVKDGIIKATFIESNNKNVIFGHYLATGMDVRIESEEGSDFVDCKQDTIRVERIGKAVIVR